MPVIRFSNNSHWENLNQLISILKTLQHLHDGDRVDIDSNGFATPFHVVPSACVINRKKLTFGISDDKSGMSQYLKIIQFPDGISAKDAKPGVSGNYLPIARVTGKEGVGAQREKSYKNIEDQYRELILNCFSNLKDKLSNAIAFFLSELIENAKDHSDAENFYIFAQYWPALKEFELCLMDDGIGLQGSLSKIHPQITTHERAVREIIQRQLSARISDIESLPGTGLANTIRIVSNKELQSTFTLLSGNFGYSCSNDYCKWVDLGTLAIKGTLINIRIKEPRERVNIFNYIQ